MFDPFARKDDDLDAAITSAYTDLRHHTADSEEHRNIVSRLTELYALQNSTAQLSLQAQQTHAAHQLECDKNAWSEEQDMRPFYKRVDPTVALTVFGNLAVALVVVKYEQTNAIGTKVPNFLMKRI